jgi:tetratricopeptide (TPR) repeat protein
MTRRAEATLRELVAKAPSETRYLEGLARCLQCTSLLLFDQGLLAESLAVMEESRATLQKLVDAQPEVHRFQNDLAIQQSNIAETYWKLGQPVAVFAPMRRALAIWRKAAEAYPAVTRVANNFAYGLDEIANYLIDAGRPAEALESLAEARPILRKLVAMGNADEAPTSNLAANYIWTGRALVRMGMWREAEEAFEEAVSIDRKLDERLSRKGHQLWEPFGLSVFGWTLWKAGRVAEAASAFGRERAIRQRFATAGPAEVDARRKHAVCESNSAAALLSLGRLAEARACCDNAIAICEGLLQRDPEGLEAARLLAVSRLRLGSVRATAGDLAGAAAILRLAEALYAAHPPHNEPAIFHACCHGALAGLAGKAGSGLTAEEGASHAEKAMAILQQVSASGYLDPDLLRVEPGLDPLRSRDDFRLLMMDQAFPAEPFAYRVDEEFRPVPAPLITTAPAEK